MSHLVVWLVGFPRFYVQRHLGDGGVWVFLAFQTFFEQRRMMGVCMEVNKGRWVGCSLLAVSWSANLCKSETLRYRE